LTSPAVDQRRNSLRHLLWTLAAVQLALVAAGVIVWTRSHGETALTDQRLTALAVATRPTSLESATPVVLRAARAWRSNAVAVSESLQVDWPWEVSADPQPIADGGFATFVFASTGDAGGPATLSVVVERLSGLVVRREEHSWSQALPPAISLIPSAVDSLAALDVAEHAGGTAFRRGCPSQRHETRLSRVESAGAPDIWLVSYPDVRDPTMNALELRIDATTGELLDHINRSRPCEIATEAPG
jgi:hypothetical protein